MKDFPEVVLHYLQRVLIQERSPAFLAINQGGILTQIGGSLSTYGLNQLKTGEPIGGQTDFLEGLLPLESHEVLLPCIEVSPGHFADAHLLHGDQQDLVLLIDATTTEIEQGLLHQKANDLHLLRSHHSQFLNLLSGLDIALLERINSTKLRAIGTPPEWIEDCGLHFDAGENVFQIQDELDFLYCFLQDAEDFWRSNEIRLKSGPWVESDPQRAEWYFEATAIKNGKLEILLIERIAPYSDERFAFLQKGREQNLDYIRLARKEKALREKELRNRVLLQAVPDWIFRINRQGTILDLKATMGKNPAMFAEFVGQPLSEVFPEDAAKKMIRCADEALKSNQLQTCNFPLGSSGSNFDFEARVVAIGPNEVVMIVRDLPA